jgi:murein L,D-transpeptidase YafK
MKNLLLILCLAFIGAPYSMAQQILEEQLNYSRVRDAKEDNHESLKKMFAAKQVSFPPQEIYLRSFKFDKEMELWAKGGENQKFQLIKTYDICKVSGELGPKRQQGDLQIPEGIYQLEQFNPVSNYHLSMKINYPNEADRLLGKTGSLGGDIYIHGDCVTIGCIPIEDEPIKELYWLSVLTKGEGGKIPIHIFPFRMDKASIQFFKQIPNIKSSVWTLWNQLLPIYSYFQEHEEIPAIDINSKGEYVIEAKENQ